MGFASAGVPRLLDIWQNKGDQKHELALMAMQREREVALAREGFVAQAQVEMIKTEQIEMQTQAQEKLAIWKHDSKLAEGGSTWVINLRASVRPVVTYIFVGLLVVVDIAGIWYAYSTGVAFAEAMELVFSSEEMAILSAIISFHFGGRAFSK